MLTTSHLRSFCFLRSANFSLELENSIWASIGMWFVKANSKVLLWNWQKCVNFAKRAETQAKEWSALCGDRRQLRPALWNTTDGHPNKSSLVYEWFEFDFRFVRQFLAPEWSESAIAVWLTVKCFRLFNIELIESIIALMWGQRRSGSVL